MDESRVEQLINQCRSNDVDVKVDAVTKLQAEFEAGVEIEDPDALITVLKACLRTPNQHLSTATLSALPPLLPLLTSRLAYNNTSGNATPQTISPAASTSSIQSSVVDVHTLRQVLSAFLPAGGVIDRLGDSREKAKEKARETLVILGGLAFRSGGSGSVLGKGREGKGPETPLMMLERFLREGGLASKVWRVREQTILILVHIRRAHHLFPIRPYLPALVETLEDPDATVRGTAQTSVVELFTGPAVSDAARADLKKEMTKKGVRKGIVESVLAKVLGGASTPHTGSDAGSENGDVATVNVPPSIALMNKKPGPTVVTSGQSKPLNSSRGEPSRPASRAAALASPASEAPPPGSQNKDVRPVYIASSRDLENEFASMLKPFEGKETEHNWAAREQAILRVRGMLKGEVHERFTETFLLGLKQGFLDASIKASISLRTTVASNTCSLYSELAITLGPNLEQFCDTLYHNLIRMASLTKKIISQQSQGTVGTIIINTSGQPRLLLPILWNTLQDKAIQPRVYAMAHVKTFLETHAARSRQSIESCGGVEILEKIIKKSLVDPNPGVKEQARQSYWIFEGVWRDRAQIIMDKLDNLSRKQLEKMCPNPAALQVIPPVTPATKKSSVAAAIAASRAKAKAIATAPPTLRHQATSAARSTTSPPTKRAVSPSLSTSSSHSSVRATSPIVRVASSSSPPRARVVSAGGLSRSASSGFVPSRDPSSRGKVPPSPPSPTPNAAFHRRVSSPLVVTPSSSSHGTLRRAIETALPASPPSRPSVLHTSPTPRPHSAKTAPVPAFHRESINITGFNASDEESLLLASNIPIPEDDGSDSDMDMDVEGDESVNLISFSTPYERYHPGSGASFSPRSSSSKPAASGAVSATNSPPAGMSQPTVEDAMRARAEQAESAAERLLELVEPEEESSQELSLHASLLLGSAQVTPKFKAKASAAYSSKGGAASAMLRTPVHKTDAAAAIFRKAALFQDSPAPRNGGSAPSVFDMIDTRTIQSDWWAKRVSLMNQTVSQVTAEPSDRRTELNVCVSTLENGTTDVQVLKQLALLCKANPVNEPMSPISPGYSDPLSPSPLFGNGKASSSELVLKSDLWTQEKAFDRLLNGLIKFLDTNKNAADLEYGLIVLWEMLENQALFLEGREADIFAVLLRIRYCGQPSVLQATITFRDALTQRIEPVYGLTTMHASVRAFRDSPLLPGSNAEIKDGSLAFGLIALGKFMLRLPAEVLEDELPRLRPSLIAALTDNSNESSTVVREAAAASIIAAQLVIQDETHVFTLLDGLPEDKKNLLAYLFDKHSMRGTSGFMGQSGIDKLGKEILRLDNRTSMSTPPRPALQSPINLS
ncbi:hypothetical protein EUX98_g406 [Antrodiella citrinella]|uniref:CLASP N-terminal domain-containing protein n=1 Tax=Antrodiella citrinella TaxID=2447956 RepID=A0A4S4N425_9APHY|nr:hypothetical protein EUX98_g406 [Antrodiella citrinella]